MNRGFNGTLLDKIAELGLPNNNEFVLTDSGALAERGVIPPDAARDIDGVASPENRDYLRRLVGWKAIERVVGYKDDGRRVRITALTDAEGTFDIYPHGFSMYDYNRTGSGRLQLPELIELSDQDPVTGIWVARIEYVERTKLETGRPKDQARLRAIETFHQNMS